MGRRQLLGQEGTARQRPARGWVLWDHLGHRERQNPQRNIQDHKGQGRDKILKGTSRELPQTSLPAELGSLKVQNSPKNP